jgi:TetR/AcrR family transcriptional repressor of nem operon
MDKSSTKAERTRKFIIESTAEIFNRKGFSGTSLSDLTEATGLTKGSIYGNFENKEEVALAVFDFNYSIIRSLIREELSKVSAPRDKLMVYANVYQTINRSPDDRGGCPILNTAVEADDTNYLLKNKAAQAIVGWADNLSAIMESGIQSGVFRADIKVRQLALTIIALVEGGLMIARATDDPANMDQVVATIEQLISQMEC